MSLYFPTVITNIIVKYATKEMVNYLKHKKYDWKKLYYELYRENEIKRIYRYETKNIDDNKKQNKYLNAIINRIYKKYRTYAEGCTHKISIHDRKVGVNGSSSYGALGLGYVLNTGDTWPVLDFQYEIGRPLDFNRKAVHVACGSSHSILLFNDGKIMGTGYSNSGELGDLDHSSFRAFPNKFTTFGQTYLSLNMNKVWERCVVKDEIIWVECGRAHSMLLLENGKVLATGDNRNDQINFNPGTDFDKYNFYEWTELPLHFKATQIACGPLSSIILLKNKKVLMAGMFNLKHRNELHDPTQYMINCYDEIEKLDNVAQIKCGFNHIMILQENGELLAMGSNYYGQLGISNDNKPSYKLIKVGFVGNAEISQIDCENYSSTVLLMNGIQFKTNNKGGWKKINFN